MMKQRESESGRAVQPESFAGAVRRLGWALPVGALLVLWAQYFWWLRVEWDLNANYGYGPMVPIAAVALLWLRGERMWATPSAPRFRLSFGGVAIGAILLLVPVYIVAEVNPDWRLLMWITAAILVGLSVFVAYSLGGFPWARASLPILGFLCVAIPWPVSLEQWLLQVLMRSVAGTAGDLFHLLGYTVVVRGNLVVLDGFPLGIDEACSGIRSFQFTLVLATFLVLWRPLSPARAICLGGGLLLGALLVNLGRVCVLGVIAHSSGQEVMEQWHDLVGTLSMLFLAVGGWGLHWLVQAEGDSRPRLSRVEAAEAERAFTERTFGIWPKYVGMMFLIAVAVPYGAKAVYYGMEVHAEPVARIAFDWDRLGEGVSHPEIDAGILSQMRFSEGERFLYGDSSGWLLHGFELYWEDGRLSSFSSVHRPENCLPSIGYRMVGELAPLVAQVGGRELEFRAYLFEQGGREFYVFHAMWDLLRGESFLTTGAPGRRFERVAARSRFGPTQALFLMVSGVRDSRAALDVLREVMGRARLGEVN